MMDIKLPAENTPAIKLSLPANSELEQSVESDKISGAIMQKRAVKKEDGRKLIYYSFTAGVAAGAAAETAATGIKQSKISGAEINNV